jgi:regulator of sigma E protease
VNWIGIEQPQAVLPNPVENSLFATAGFLGGERVDRAGYEDEELEDIVSFDDLRWRLLRGALEQRDMRLEYRDAAGTPGKVIAIPLSRLKSTDADSLLLKKVGVLSAFSQARIGDTFTGGAAQEAGLRNGDVVVSVDTKAVTDAPQLRDVIRQGGRTGLAQTQQWKIRREGTEQTIAVTPKVELENGQSIGRVGAYIGAMPALVLVRLGPLAGMQRALYQTWEVSLLTVKMLGKILVGEASLKSLSGPITIADFAGRSAANGIAHYLGFLALISISLGVLNLLPVPVLDGGHLMYYLWESLTGKPVSDSWMEGMQRIGLAMLLLLMSVAIFNDVTRLLG